MALAAIVDEKVEILLSLDSSSGSSSTQSDSRAAGLSAWPVMSRTGVPCWRANRIAEPMASFIPV